MFLEKGIFTGRKNKIAVGFDLGDRTSQISFCRLDGGEPETLSMVAGEEQYNFPTLLCRRKDGGQWACGREAQRLTQAGETEKVEHLLTLARERQKVEAGSDSFEAVALLALFLKRSLGLLAMPQQVEALMITVDSPDRELMEVLTEAAVVMQIPDTRIFFQSHQESFYQYMLHQPEELWRDRALSCEFEDGRLKAYCLENNQRTTPAVAFVEEKEYSGVKQEDGRLLEILQENCGDRLISSAYLLGRGFEGDWYQNSLRYLCKGRRVFRGNNLYSKGACYGALEKLSRAGAESGHVFLGRDKLKANLGLQALRQGQDSYFALLDAGENWYEVKKECEFYLESGNSFLVRVDLVTENESREIEIILDGLPERGERATRLRLWVSMSSDRDVSLSVEDLGLGEIYPGSHRVWEQKFTI